MYDVIDDVIREVLDVVVVVVGHDDVVDDDVDAKL